MMFSAFPKDAGSPWGWWSGAIDGAPSSAAAIIERAGQSLFALAQYTDQFQICFFEGDGVIAACFIETGLHGNKVMTDEGAIAGDREEFRSGVEFNRHRRQEEIGPYLDRQNYRVPKWKVQGGVRFLERVQR